MANLNQFGAGLQSQITRYPDDGVQGLIHQSIAVAPYFYPLAFGFQSVSYDVGVVAASTDYSITVNNTTVTVNSGTDTAEDVAAALVVALKNNSYINGLYRISSIATIVTLIHRSTLINETVTGTGDAIIFSVADSTANDVLPLGRILALDEAEVDGELPTIKLPASGADVIVGAGGTYSHNDAYARDAQGRVVVGRNPGSAINVLRAGSILLEAEAAVTAGTPLLYRHTADGSLDQLGVVAPAAGTGLQALAGLTAAANSFVSKTGTIIVPATINLPQ